MANGTYIRAKDLDLKVKEISYPFFYEDVYPSVNLNSFHDALKTVLNDKSTKLAAYSAKAFINRSTIHRHSYDLYSRCFWGMAITQSIVYSVADTVKLFKQYKQKFNLC